MFRLLITAYLCLGAVFAPLLCCCAVEHSMNSSPVRACCKAAAKTHGQASRTTHQAPLAQAALLPGRHHSGSCLCDKHPLKATAARTHKVEVPSGDGVAAWAHDALAPSSDAVRDPSDIVSATSMRFTNGPPASLFGRDMLRAFSILRC